jgi:hypothetical protein
MNRIYTNLYPIPGIIVYNHVESGIIWYKSALGAVPPGTQSQLPWIMAGAQISGGPACWLP